MEFEERFDQQSLRERRKRLKREPLSPFIDSTLPQGRCISIHSEGALIFFENRVIVCQMKGTFKQGMKRKKHLLAVGDIVHFDPERALIVSIAPRRSFLSRADHLRQREEQLIATNIDQLLITSTLVSPQIKPSLIDRYIAAAYKGNIQPILLFNKKDLANRSEIQPWIDLYRSLGITVLETSPKTGEGMEELKELMRNKASVFSGQSGVGKTSLINEVTQSSFLVKEIAKKNGKGVHTTSTSLLIPLKGGGFCIDTPGIKSFSLFSLDKKKVESYFEDISVLGQGCSFPGCSHLHEPSCAVRRALEEGLLAPTRYLSYITILKEIRKHYE